MIMEPAKPTVYHDDLIRLSSIAWEAEEAKFGLSYQIVRDGEIRVRGAVHQTQQQLPLR